MLGVCDKEESKVKVGKDRIAALGLSTGSWLRELKHAVLTGAPGETPINVQWRDRHGKHALTREVSQLRHLVLDIVPGRRIGYVTDLRYTEENVADALGPCSDVDLLYIESTFLNADEEHAARKNHLTAGQAGQIARRVGAKAIVPIPFLATLPRTLGHADCRGASGMVGWLGAASRKAHLDSEGGEK